MQGGDQREDAAEAAQTGNHGRADFYSCEVIDGLEQ